MSLINLFILVWRGEIVVGQPQCCLHSLPACPRAGMVLEHNDQFVAVDTFNDFGMLNIITVCWDSRLISMEVVMPRKKDEPLIQVSVI